jgi:hypothetical protein
MPLNEKKKRMKYRDNYEKDSEWYMKYDYVAPFTEDDELRMKEIKKELSKINPKFIEVAGNRNQISNRLMMQRLSDILSGNQLNRKFIQAHDKETGTVILKPAKNNKATYDGKNKKQKKKQERMNEINIDMNMERDDAQEAF